MGFLEQQKQFNTWLRNTLHPEQSSKHTITELKFHSELINGVMLSGVYEFKYLLPRNYFDAPIGKKCILNIDINSSNREYFWSIFTDIRSQFPKESNSLIKNIKQTRYQHRAQRKEPLDIFPQHLINWAWEFIHSQNLDYVDNFRMARIGNSSQKRRYRKQQSEGCCGFFDIVRAAPDGQRYMIGCNYGH